MNDEHCISFIYDKAGKYVADFLKPYMERFNLNVDTNRSSNVSIYLLGPNGEYAGTVSFEDGVSKYLVYLNTEGTLVLSGEINQQYITGAIEKMNLFDRNSLEEFTTFSMIRYDERTECTSNHYTENIKEITRKIIPAPLNWTWKDINNLFTVYGSQLEPSFTRKFENLSDEEFMNAMLLEYNSVTQITQKAV